MKIFIEYRNTSALPDDVRSELINEDWEDSNYKVFEEWKISLYAQIEIEDEDMSRYVYTDDCDNLYMKDGDDLIVSIRDEDYNALYSQGEWKAWVDNDYRLEMKSIWKARETPSEQVGGNHYSKYKIMPFDIIREYKMDFFEGNALKYLMRHKNKGGLEDLKKAIHYIKEIARDNYEGDI